MMRGQRGFLLNPFRFTTGGGASDPYGANVALLLHCDGANGSTAFTDASPSTKTVTAYGNAQISTASSKFGGASALFDGVGDYLESPNSDKFNLGTGDFTVEFWVKTSFNASGISPSPRLLAPALSTNAAGAFQIWQVTSTTYGSVVNGVALAKPDGTGYVVSTTSAVNDGNWHHIAITRASGTSMIFLDGALQQSAADSNDYSKLAMEGLRIAGRGDLAANSFFTGSLDEIRITRGVARYTANFTSPTAAFPDPVAGSDYAIDGLYSYVAMLLHGNGTNGSTTVVDNSPSTKTVTAYGNAQISTASSRFGGASLLFDGDGDYLEAAAHSDYTIGTGDFTVEFWVNTTYAISGTLVSRRIIAPKTSYNVAGCFQVWQVASTTYGAVVNGIALAKPDGTGYVVSTTSAVNDGNWHHIAITRTAGTSRIFMDGVLHQSAADTNSYTLLQTEGIKIGARGNLTLEAFYSGRLDDLRITKNISRYRANFAPPTSEFQNS